MDDIDTIPSRLHDIDPPQATSTPERPEKTGRVWLVLALLGAAALAWFVWRR